MALVKQTLQAGGLNLQIEIEDGRLRSIELPKRVPADFNAADLKKLNTKLAHFKPAVDSASPFTRKVWERMRKIQPGKTMSYSELAAAIGHPKSARAVGGAVGRNRLLLLLPCHRVVGKNGLGGFRVGLDWKRKLLALEAAHA